MDGDPTDNNAKLFAQGYNGVLKPKFADGDYVKVGEPAGTWIRPPRQTTFEQQFTAHPNINAVVTPNDDNANAVSRSCRRTRSRRRRSRPPVRTRRRRVCRTS